MSNLVSVIIPTYNRVDSLERAVKSVLKQTFNNFEIIVVDDEQNGKSVQNILKNFKNNKILYFKNERTKGANGARNTGILKAKGNFIAFLDDDDEWLPDKLKNQISNIFLTEDECAGLFGAYFIENNSSWKRRIYDIQEISLKNAILNVDSIGSSSNLLIKRSVFDLVGLWDEELHRQQDLELLIRITNRFKIIYDKNIAIKIYGHNTPNPNKAFVEREKFINKISKYIYCLTSKEKNQFYSDHYRRQAIFLLKMRNFELTKVYLEKARSYKFISLKKDLKIIQLYIKNKIY